jgi:hypothetical protein
MGVGATSAHAQFGGFGFGGYGGGWGGGMGMMGMSLYDQQMMKESMWMQSAASYNMMNAQASQSYSSANLMEQQAINTALQNQKLANSIAQDKYNLYTQAKNKAIAEARANAPRIPLRSLIASDGTVLWPEVAPSGGVHADRRSAADRSIKLAYLDFKQMGQAGVTDVVNAKHNLQQYGQPALALLRTRNDTRARGDLLTFLNGLDAALDAMGDPPKDEKADDTPQRGNR